MSEYNKQCREEHHRASLEVRRNRLRALFQEEMKQLQIEQRDVLKNRPPQSGRQWQKRERNATRLEMTEKVGWSLLAPAKWAVVLILKS